MFNSFYQQPNKQGKFGEFGGAYVAETLMPAVLELQQNYAKIQNDWKKLKSFTITNSGYHAYFGLLSSALSQEAEFDVSEDATKAQIKSAFVKSLKTKKLNKKVLGEFISLVA